MRRQFELPEEDQEYLNSLGLEWETVKDGNTLWLLIHNYPVPPGYNVDTAVIGIRIAGYPPGKLDMAYYYPPLSRADGKAINKTSSTAIEGKSFQQWSRHYPWREGEDNLATHLLRMDHWLSAEFEKR